MQEVTAKLREVNPNYRGEPHLEFNQEGVKILWLHGNGNEITDLWPVGALKALEELGMNSTNVSDLSPLVGLPIKRLHCDSIPVKDWSLLRDLPLTLLNISDNNERHHVADLDFLKGKPLTHLGVKNTLVKDISPLAGAPLTSLNIADTPVSDLSPLKGMTLESLICQHTNVSDLSPLAGMPLVSLSVYNTPIADLSPLRGMQLTTLQLFGTNISDLSPLAGMPLTSLNITRTRVGDLSPLKGMPLKNIGLEMRLFHEGDERLLRSLPLKTVELPNQGESSVEEFWKQIAAQRQTAETFASEISKLPVDEQVKAIEARLEELNKSEASLGIVPQDGAILECTLVFDPSAADATPLRALKGLKKLRINGGVKWLDLSPLNNVPLEELNCSPEIAARNAPVLQAMATLKTVNGKPNDGHAAASSSE